MKKKPYTCYCVNLTVVNIFFPFSGSKIVIRGHLDKASCGMDKYQPFKFVTKGNTDCILLKSKCSDEGQLIHNKGNSSSDSMCRCDYTKGYAFVKKPSALCFCNPVIEDCSCFKVQCKNGSFLTPGKYLCKESTFAYH